MAWRLVSKVWEAARQNGDFFGNEIADFTSVYRSGYSDLFSAIFNHSSLLI